MSASHTQPCILKSFLPILCPRVSATAGSLSPALHSHPLHLTFSWLFLTLPPPPPLESVLFLPSSASSTFHTCCRREREIVSPHSFICGVYSSHLVESHHNKNLSLCERARWPHFEAHRGAQRKGREAQGLTPLSVVLGWRFIPTRWNGHLLSWLVWDVKMVRCLVPGALWDWLSCGNGKACQMIHLLKVREVALLEMDGVCRDDLFGDGYQRVTSSTHAFYLKRWKGRGRLKDHSEHLSPTSSWTEWAWIWLMAEESKVQNCLASCMDGSVHRDCQDEGWLLSWGAECGLICECVRGPDLVHLEQKKEWKLSLGPVQTASRKALGFRRGDVEGLCSFQRPERGMNSHKMKSFCHGQGQPKAGEMRDWQSEARPAACSSGLWSMAHRSLMSYNAGQLRQRP